MNPRSVATWRVLGTTLLRMRRYPEAREALDRALALSPTNIDALQYRAMTFVAQGDLAGARETVKAALKEVDPTELVVAFANYYSLGWVLERRAAGPPAPADAERLRRRPGRLGRVPRGRVRAARRRGRTSESTRSWRRRRSRRRSPRPRRTPAATASSATRSRSSEERRRRSARASAPVALDPLSKDKLYAPFDQHQFALIYILVGEHERALDLLEPLLRMPYFLSPGWLKIDPAFDPLRGNPRFQKLVAAK